MPRWADFALLAALAFLGWFGRLLFLRNRLTPAELEKRRRESVNRNGKLGDGEIIDIGDSAIVYSYSVAGVHYTTAQDISALEALLPDDRMAAIGPASVKFLTTSPGNSIVVCEDWNGLRGR